MKNTIKLLFLGLFLFGMTAVNAQINTSTGGAGAILPNFSTSNANVGIGTNAPTGKIDVMGPSAEVSLNANSFATANFRIQGYTQLAINTSITSPYITSLQSKHATLNGIAYPIALNPLGGNVGIGTGTTTPDQKLTVKGSVSIGSGTVNANTTKLFINNEASNGKKWAFSSGINMIAEDSFGIYNWTNSSATPYFAITTTGNVGIGTTAPGAKLEVAGNGLFQGGLTSSISNNEGGFISLNNPTKTSAGMGSSWKIYNTTGVYGNSLQFYVYDNLGCVTGGLCAPRMTLLDSGNVGIGTKTPDEKLAVNGTIHAKEVRVDLTGWPDYVFEKYFAGKSILKSDYVMPTLIEVEQYAKTNNHLPNVPSAKEIQKNGLQLGEMNSVLLQKIEELTLYAIEQQRELDRLKTENEKYKSLSDRLSAIEKELKK